MSKVSDMDVAAEFFMSAEEKKKLRERQLLEEFRAEIAREKEERQQMASGVNYVDNYLLIY